MDGQSLEINKRLYRKIAEGFGKYIARHALNFEEFESYEFKMYNRIDDLFKLLHNHIYFSRSLNADDVEFVNNSNIGVQDEINMIIASVPEEKKLIVKQNFLLPMRDLLLDLQSEIQKNHLTIHNQCPASNDDNCNRLVLVG